MRTTLSHHPNNKTINQSASLYRWSQYHCTVASVAVPSAHRVWLTLCLHCRVCGHTSPLIVLVLSVAKWPSDLVYCEHAECLVGAGWVCRWSWQLLRSDAWSRFTLVCTLHVCVEVALLRERHKAVCTLVRPLTAMSSDVCVQRALLIKGAATLHASKRSFTWHSNANLMHVWQLMKLSQLSCYNHCFNKL